MIGKHIQNLKGQSSFKRLNDYITGKTNRKPEEKIAFTDCINLTSVETATLEMEALAFQNKRCGDPVMHLLLSWRENENPTREQVQKAVKITLSELDLTECQTLYSLHQNTDNMHLHLCVNRVHPETYLAINPAHGWTRRAMEKSARKIEYSQGWQVENNTWTEIDEHGEIVRKPITSDVRVPPKPKDMENLTGEKSAVRKAQEALSKETIKNISSWKKLHTFMRQNGMEYRKKGSGAVIVLGDVVLKASSVSRTLALSRLEERFGDYRQPEVIPIIAKKLSDTSITGAKPLDKANDNANWKAYIQAREDYYRCGKQAGEELRKTQREQFKKMKDRQKGERGEMFESLKVSSASRQEFIRQRSLLAAKHTYEFAALKKSHREQREKSQRSNLGFPSYKQWLIDLGLPLEAETWRHRRNREYLRIESGGIEGPNSEASVNLGLLGFTMTETKQGLRFSRQGRLGMASFIDVGRMIRVYGSDDETLLASLQLAAQKWGTIQLHGSDSYKRHCVELAVENGIKIANPELQGLRREIEQGRKGRFAEGIAKSKARFAERQKQEAEKKRHQEAEEVRQQSERLAAEKRARELELERKRQKRGAGER
jgi:hypothetical protein